jgi:hypothetical protein
VIAEKHVDLAAVVLPAVRAIDSVHADGAAQRAPQHSAVAGCPAVAHFGGDAEGLVGNGTLRGPQAHRRHAELALHVLAGHRQLLVGVFRIAKRRRQRDAGMRHRGDVGVAQQRQDRVIVRRCGDFDLPGSGHLAIDRDHLAQDLQLFASHQPLVVERVIEAFGEQLGNLRIAGAELLVEPDQLRDHLQVAEILRREAAARQVEAALGVARFVEAGVARKRLGQARRMRLQKLCATERSGPRR